MEKIDWSEYFYYDETSPTCLRNKLDKFFGFHNSRLKFSKDSVAGNLDSKGYYRIKLMSKEYRVHRIILALHGVELSRCVHVDHIDGCTTNNTISNLRAVCPKQNRRNVGMCVRNTSGVTGVCFVLTKHGTGSYKATWMDEHGVRRSKYFSVNKLGIMVAFRDAVIHRQKMIEELNSQGAGYTERHGKEH